MKKNLYAIYHRVDVDGGFGDAVPTEDMVGLAWATEDEVKAYIEKWNKPEIYDIPYSELFCHKVRVERATALDDISLVKPYSTDPDHFYNRSIKEVKEVKEYMNEKKEE